jgi:hypothetical protein
MAVTGVSNLTELISSQPLGQGHVALAGVGIRPLQTQNAGASTLVEDSFTPSSQLTSNQATAQDAGLFQVSQFALSAVATDSLNAQPPVREQPSVTAVAPAANAITVPSDNTQNELQALNRVLLGLGLTNSDIEQIDRVATLTKLYSPRLYTDLVEQLKAQAALRANLALAGEKPATQPKAAAG